jgi:XTP/dITP diphosphohydrolase
VKLVLATRNAHKAREFATLLAPHEILPLPDDVELPPETGETFEANAREKALAAARATGLAAIADDSGIEAAALGARPGVRSARFAGETATDEENLAKLLREAPAGSPLAYVCALLLAAPEEIAAGAARHAPTAPARAVILHAVEGRCTGTLATGPRGDGGFGYDPAFLPDDLDDGRTMAELEPHEKDAISHRGRAARALLQRLEG